MKHLVLVRHGESNLNVVNKEKRVYCGQIDTHLTDFGRIQAVDAGGLINALAYLRLQRAISSPLQRAHVTLSILLAELGGNVLQLPARPELTERSHGEFEGLSDEEVFQKFPELRNDPNHAKFMNSYDRCAPGGETLAMVSARAWPVIDKMMSEPADGDLLVVSHYNTIRCIIGQALKLAPEQIVKISIPNAVPIVLRLEERYELVEGLEVNWR